MSSRTPPLGARVDAHATSGNYGVVIALSSGERASLWNTKQTRDGSGVGDRRPVAHG